MKKTPSIEPAICTSYIDQAFDLARCTKADKITVTTVERRG